MGRLLVLAVVCAAGRAWNPGCQRLLLRAASHPERRRPRSRCCGFARTQPRWCLIEQKSRGARTMKCRAWDEWLPHLRSFAPAWIETQPASCPARHRVGLTAASRSRSLQAAAALVAVKPNCPPSMLAICSPAGCNSLRTTRAILPAERPQTEPRRAPSHATPHGRELFFLAASRAGYTTNG